MSFVIRFTIHVSRFTNICRGLVVSTLVLLVVWFLSDVVSAQVLVPAPTPLPKELQKPEPPVPGILPPAPVPERRGPMPTVKVYVREILVLGSTVFTPQELAQITDSYRNREIPKSMMRSSSPSGGTCHERPAFSFIRIRLSRTPHGGGVGPRRPPESATNQYGSGPAISPAGSSGPPVRRST